MRNLTLLVWSLLLALLCPTGASASQDKLDLSSLSALPPVTDSLPGLEATNVRIAGHIAYVVYNTAGPVVRGGIEVVDVSDLRHPKRLGTLLYNNTEFADVAVRGKLLYLVGDTTTPAGGQTAVLKILDASNPAKIADVTTIDLPGFAATSIQMDGNEAVVSVGDNAGLSIFDVTNERAPRLTANLPFPNALYATRYKNNYVALGGGQTTLLAAFNTKGTKVTDDLELSKQRTMSPGRFEIKGKTLYTNAGTTGLSLTTLPHGAKPKCKLLSQVTVPGTGNGLDLYRDYLFLAQGQGGIYVFDVSNKNAPRSLGNLNFHFAGESTNQVRFKRTHACPFGKIHGVLFVANGSGGLRIFKVR